MNASAGAPASTCRASAEDAANDIAALWLVSFVHAVLISFKASVSDAAAKTVMSAAKATDGASAAVSASAASTKALKACMVSSPRDIGTNITLAMPISTRRLDAAVANGALYGHDPPDHSH